VAQPAPIDLRGLLPPEPLTRVLDTLSGGGSGPYVFLLDLEPRPLYLLLDAQGWAHAARRTPDGLELTVTPRSGGGGKAQ
jgi:hypothetical protein